MQLINTYSIEVKKSKFIAYYYKIDKIDEVKIILVKLKKEHKKAKHMVYAYRFNNTGGKSDDKEPQGTAGLPLYSILENNNLANNLIVIVRYFGGIKLGLTTLRRTYIKAGTMVLNKLKNND